MKARHRPSSINKGRSYYSEITFEFGPDEAFMLNGGNTGSSLSIYPKSPAEIRELSAVLFRAADALEAKQNPQPEPAEDPCDASP